MSSEQYKLLFATIGITATFSSLAFRASNSSEDDSKKMIYFLQGKRLFHASISLAISISFIYIRNEIHNIFFIELIRRYPSILKLLKAICILFAQFYFFIALSYIWGAIEKLNATLFDEKLLP
jgi:hypothetical protein